MQQSIQQITYKIYKYAYVRAELTPMESTYHLYIIKVNDILGSRRQEENKNFYIVLQVSLNGSRLTHEQTRYIYETNTIGITDEVINVDDILETTNHFRCIDLIIDKANLNITERLIKQLHYILKNGTTDSRKSWFSVGDYKKLPNEVGGKITTSPENVVNEIKQLITWYNNIEVKTLHAIIEFHYRFECIHPFQDGNGRVGRLLMFKECLKYNIVPFIIDENLKLFYYRGLKEWKQEKGYLIDTCLTAQDKFKVYLDYFKIEYEK